MQDADLIVIRGSGTALDGKWFDRRTMPGRAFEDAARRIRAAEEIAREHAITPGDAYTWLQEAEEYFRQHGFFAPAHGAAEALKGALEHASTQGLSRPRRIAEMVDDGWRPAPAPAGLEALRLLPTGEFEQREDGVRAEVFRPDTSRVAPGRRILGDDFDTRPLRGQ